MTLLKELIEIPEQVHAGDYVLNLTQGVQHPEKVVDDYVVTEQLLGCFRQAVNLIAGADRENKSKGTYLHGSFGAGKSHFMAMLYLLLHGHSAALGRSELAPLVAKELAPLRDKKFLLVPYHMLGAESLEQGILGGYVKHVRRLHPEAPIPAVTKADRLFVDAEQLRDRLGDDKFFEVIGEAAGGGGDGWGDFGGGWTLARYQAARRAAPGDAEHTALVQALTTSLLSSYSEVARDFLPLDPGLAEVSKHAKALGYDGVILFLDELILWLASKAANLEWIQNEAQKIVKLVEHQEHRAIPIVSFIARQRDLKELVGASATGIEWENFAQALNHMSGRFEQITLEDRNLPLVVEKRLLRTRSNEARSQLHSAFDEFAKVEHSVLDVLQTGEHDRDAFRRVYPFSPALIESLVAVSSVLQRERTAIKILMQLLVAKRDTLELGRVVPVGDLWDRVSDEAQGFTDSQKSQFENARKLYHQHFLPMLLQEHSLASLEEAREQAASDTEVARKLAALENHLRLVKTLLLSALVPEVEVLKNLTAARLSALNYGCIRTPIPGAEAAKIISDLRKWATRVPQLRVGDEAQPVIRLNLDGVDVESIIQDVRGIDNDGNRQRELRELLFEQMEVDDQKELFTERVVEWRGSERTVSVRYGNVRKLADRDLAQEGPDWKLIVDYPFDQEEGSADDDLERLQKFREGGEGACTIVWLPHFFSRQTQQMLGRYVCVQHLLKGDHLRNATPHQAEAMRQQARQQLESLRGSLRSELLRAINMAYGIQKAESDLIDASNDFVQVVSLHPTIPLQRPVGATLADGLEHVISQALDQQFDDHPRFEGRVELKDLRATLDAFRDSLGAEGQRAFVSDKAKRVSVLRVAPPLKLGKMGETHFTADTFWRNLFEKHMNAEGLETPTVADLRRFTDLPKPRGLDRRVQDLLIIAFAEQTNRSLKLHGTPEPAEIGKINDDAVLQAAELPTAEEWKTARERSNAIFGVEARPFLSAANVEDWAKAVREEIETYGESARALPGLLQEHAPRIAFPEGLPEATPRLVTAQEVVDVLDALSGSGAHERARGLAQVSLTSAPDTLGKSFKGALGLVKRLKDTQWNAFDLLANPPAGKDDAAQEVLVEVAKAFRQDDLVTALDPKLPVLVQKALGVLQPGRTSWISADQGEYEAPGIDPEKIAEVVRETLGRYEGQPVRFEWKILRKKDGA